LAYWHLAHVEAKWDARMLRSETTDKAVMAG
jgi:hypothetical protein